MVQQSSGLRVGYGSSQAYQFNASLLSNDYVRYSLTRCTKCCMRLRVVVLSTSGVTEKNRKQISLEILGKKFGVSSSSLQWLHSNLSGRTFSVTVNCQTSDVVDVESTFHNDPRSGRFCSISDVCIRIAAPSDTAWLSTVRRRHSTQWAKVRLHQSQSTDSTVNSDWCNRSEVAQLNGTRQQLAKLSQADLTLSVGDSVLQPSTVVRNIDEHLSMEANAGYCSTCDDLSAVPLCNLTDCIS